MTIREMIATLTSLSEKKPAANLTQLAQLRRTALAYVRENGSKELVKALNTLRFAPILLNFDSHSSHQPLAEIRQAERGVGDHALTLFDTGETMVFDQSHIFFDGSWGAALAEIMTNEALSWAVYLSALPRARADGPISHSPTFRFNRQKLN